MPAYRYILFPRGRQPSTEEIRQLHTFDGVLARRYAFGVDARENRLAIAFDEAVFDYACATEPGFAALLEKWTHRGCELLEHLQFIKDSAALRPTAVPSAPSAATRPAREHRSPGDGVPTDHGTTRSGMSPDRVHSAKELLAHEAVARSQLAMAHTLARMEALQRFGAAAPYLAIAACAAMFIGAGFYIHGRLESSPAERREETINRVLDDPLEEPLEAQSGLSSPTEERR